MRLLPISDYGPNDGTPTPSSPATHYDKVDEASPNSDTDYVTIALQMGEEAFALDVSALKVDDLIPSLGVEWTAKAGDTTYQARAGLLIAGVRYYAAARNLTTNYSTFTETFAVDPSDGNAWTKAKLGALAVIAQHTMIGSTLPRPRVTAIAGIVTPIPAAPRPSASPADTASDASISGGSATAVPAGVSRSASESGSAPSGSAAAVAPAAIEAALAAMATAAAMTHAAILSGGNPSASVAAVAPQVSAAPTGPTAIPSIIAPESDPS